MKKLFFATIIAVFMTLVPQNVNAANATECVITVNSGETKTINYDTEGCRVENRGTLNIVNGAKIAKYTQNSYASIDNYGVLNISGGYIYADYGYTIFNKAGSVNVSGGTIHSILHQAIWASTGTNTKITGGTLKGAIGGEEVIYTKGNLSICGGTFNSSRRSNLGYDAEVANCPIAAKPVETTQVAKPAETKPIASTQTVSQTKTVQAAPKTTVQTPKAEETIAISEPEVEQTKTVETKNVEPESDEPAAGESLPEAGATETHLNTGALITAFATAFLSGIIAAYVVSRSRH